MGFVETRQKLGAVPWKETQRWEAPGKAGGVKEAGVRKRVRRQIGRGSLSLFPEVQRTLVRPLG